jgi:hypothetical protein
MEAKKCFKGSIEYSRPEIAVKDIGTRVRGVLYFHNYHVHCIDLSLLIFHLRFFGAIGMKQ